MYNLEESNYFPNNNPQIPGALIKLKEEYHELVGKITDSNGLFRLLPNGKAKETLKKQVSKITTSTNFGSVAAKFYAVNEAIISFNKETGANFLGIKENKAVKQKENYMHEAKEYIEHYKDERLENYEFSFFEFMSFCTSSNNLNNLSEKHEIVDKYLAYIKNPFDSKKSHVASEIIKDFDKEMKRFDITTKSFPVTNDEKEDKNVFERIFPNNNTLKGYYNKNGNIDLNEPFAITKTINDSRYGFIFNQSSDWPGKVDVSIRNKEKNIKNSISMVWDEKCLENILTQGELTYKTIPYGNNSESIETSLNELGFIKNNVSTQYEDEIIN